MHPSIIPRLNGWIASRSPIFATITRVSFTPETSLDLNRHHPGNAKHRLVSAIVSTPANMSAFKYQWNQTIDVGTAGLLSKQWTSIRHILSLLVTANACVHVTAYVAVRRSLSTTYTAVVLGLLLRQYVSYQFGVWAGITDLTSMRG